MAKETVIEYETVEREEERVVSDISGDVLEPEEVITWQANPRIEGKWSPDYRSDLSPPYSDYTVYQLLDQNGVNLDAGDVDLSGIAETLNEYYSLESDGEIHTSPAEAAELEGVDLDDVEAGQEIPPYTVDREEVEVIERPWISVNKGYIDDKMVLLMSGIVLGSVVTALGTIISYVPASANSLLPIIAVCLLAVVGLFSAIAFIGSVFEMTLV